MPYIDRQGLRQRPLEHAATCVFPVGDESDIKLYAAPGYKVFIEARWHGDYQQVPVDPDELDDLIEALDEVKAFLADARASAPPLSGPTDSAAAAGLHGEGRGSER
jgi:hypothetical protein